MTKAVTKQADSALSTINYGLEGEEYNGLALDTQDVVLPHIQLLQKGVEWEELEDINWKPGDFYDSSISELVKGPFDALVVDMKKTSRMSGPKGDGDRRETLKFSSDGIHWDDGEIITADDRKAKDDKDFLNGTAVDTYHYVVIRKGTDYPILLNFKGSSYRNAKSMNFALNRMSPAWKCWTKFSTEDGESNGNKFKKLVGKVQPKAMLQDQDMANLALECWKASSTRRVVIKDDASTEAPSY